MHAVRKVFFNPGRARTLQSFLNFLLYLKGINIVEKKTVVCKQHVPLKR